MKNIIVDLENILEKCGEKEVLIEALEDALEKSENSLGNVRKQNKELSDALELIDQENKDYLDKIKALEQEIKSLKY